MSKKDYELIAQVISESKDRLEIVYKLTMIFKADNPLFEPDKFIAACCV